MVFFSLLTFSLNKWPALGSSFFISIVGFPLILHAFDDLFSIFKIRKKYRPIKVTRDFLVQVVLVGRNGRPAGRRPIDGRAIESPDFHFSHLHRRHISSSIGIHFRRAAAAPAAVHSSDRYILKWIYNCVRLPGFLASVHSFDSHRRPLLCSQKRIKKTQTSKSVRATFFYSTNQQSTRNQFKWTGKAVNQILNSITNPQSKSIHFFEQMKVLVF